MAKVISKKKQVETILDGLKDFRNLEIKIDDLFNGNLNNFQQIYIIGYEVIPAILDVPFTENYRDPFQLIGDVVFQYIIGNINKKEFWKQVNMYLSLEKED